LRRGRINTGTENVSLTLGQAARKGGLAKSTVSKAIATGKLAATRAANGTFVIDESEFARYVEASAPPVRIETVGNEQVKTTVHELADAMSRARVAEQMLVLLQAQLAEAVARCDRWEQRFDQLKLVAKDSTKRRSWWPWRRAS
jgi:hypothetical protein